MTSTDRPAVGDAAAVASHAQTFLQVWGEARSRDQSFAVRTLALFVFPLIVHLAKYVHSWLVHNFWKSNKLNAGSKHTKEKLEQSKVEVRGTHRTPSCSLGPFHPGRNSLVSQPDVPQNTGPNRRLPPAQSRCHGPKPAT